MSRRAPFLADISPEERRRENFRVRSYFLKNCKVIYPSERSQFGEVGLCDDVTAHAQLIVRKLLLCTNSGKMLTLRTLATCEGLTLTSPYCTLFYSKAGTGDDFTRTVRWLVFANKTDCADFIGDMQRTIVPSIAREPGMRFAEFPGLSVGFQNQLSPRPLQLNTHSTNGSVPLPALA